MGPRQVLQAVPLQRRLGAVDSTTTPALAAIMTGATAGLLVYVFKGPLWVSVLGGAVVAAATKASIDQAASA